MSLIMIVDDNDYLLSGSMQGKLGEPNKNESLAVDARQVHPAFFDLNQSMPILPK